jgi:hypothetical protein
MQLGQLSISSSSVDHNTAHRHGGALYVGTDASDASANSTLTVYNSTLNNNVAEANGGERCWASGPGAVGWHSQPLKAAAAHLSCVCPPRTWG